MRRLVRPLLSCLVVMSLLATALAPMPKARAAGIGQGIQVSPVVINLNAEKGQTYNLKVTVTNVTAGTLVLKSAINDFKAKDESGTPAVILDNNGATGAYSLREWISPISPLTLASHESRTVQVSVSVPADGEAGGHYGVIRFSGVPPALVGQSVSLTASVGVLVLARVEGNITEQLSLKQFFTQKNGKNSGFVADGPVDLVTRVQNTGNVHLQPVGTVVVKNMLGNNVASYKFGSSDQNVLPGSIRRYQQSFDKPRLFGRYTATVNAAYGTTGGVLIGSTSFWVIPYRLIIFLLVLVAVIFVLAKRSLKRYKARVIRQHHHPKKD